MFSPAEEFASVRDHVEARLSLGTLVPGERTYLEKAEEHRQEEDDILETGQTASGCQGRQRRAWVISGATETGTACLGSGRSGERGGATGLESRLK